MSDLRDRIAAVACGATSAGKLFPWDTLSEPQKDAWRTMADAVIAELRQLMVDKADDYVPSYAAVLRDFVYHVTDWIADE